MLKTKDYLSITDFSIAETKSLIEKARAMKRKAASQVLTGKVLALLFEKPSLRTRVSFEVAIHQLGGHCLYLSPDEIGLGKREPVVDVAKVLCRYIDGIIARTFAHQTLKMLSKNASVPVINALSDYEHPCQALADILTILEKKGKLRNLNLAYIGDGNNVANSLLLAAASTGVNFKIASPPGYELSKDIVQKAKKLAAQTDSTIVLSNNPKQVVKDADVVYTDVWTSMGQEAQAETRRRIFASFQINPKLLSLAKKDVIFMHPLPAHHGEEIASGLVDHPSSVVFDQAENRLHVQKALLAELFYKSGCTT
jgi:ornithine carbamoyltransferase